MINGQPDATRRLPRRHRDTPRWVKVFGVIALVVILLFIILMLTRGPGGHGPRRHFGLVLVEVALRTRSP
jgi:hypothetical protein